MTDLFINPYSDCRSPEEFERRRQLINLIIYMTMPPIEREEISND